MLAWALALLGLAGSTVAFLHDLPWPLYAALYYSILAIPILLADGALPAPGLRRLRPDVAVAAPAAPPRPERATRALCAAACPALCALRPGGAGQRLGRGVTSCVAAGRVQAPGPARPPRSKKVQPFSSRGDRRAPLSRRAPERAPARIVLTSHASLDPTPPTPSAEQSPRTTSCRAAPSGNRARPASSGVLCWRARARSTS